MDTWHFVSSAPELNCSPEQFSDCFFNPTFHKSTDQFAHFESALSSIISSPATSNSVISTGKLSSICNSGEISMPIHSTLPSLSVNPGFAERAAKFSRFGSRSFNGRPTQFRSNNNIELPNRSETPLMGGTNLLRVSSSPSLKNSTQTQMEMRSKNGSVSAQNKNFNKLSNSDTSDRTELANSNESSVSEQELKTPNEMNSRKRKSISRGKSKVAEIEDDSNSKRFKQKEMANEVVKTGEERENKDSPKAPEPLKDYIHVRARRGQATDSHSLAERVRREKIGERMKLLQDLVPGCNKVTGKALMLDEIINYVQSLQCQVEFLSMKLASVNPELDSGIDGLLSKERYQPNGPLPQQVPPLGASAPALYGHQPHQSQQVHTSVSKCSVEPLETTLCRSIGLNLPPMHEIFGQGLPQFGVFCEDDLQSFVQMGYGQNTNHETEFHHQTKHAT